MNFDIEYVLQRIGTAICLCSVVLLFLVSYLVPDNDWDVVGHIASAYSLNSSLSDAEIHKLTYESVANAMSPADFDEILNARPERKIWGEDPESLKQLLPFYQPRIILVGLTALGIEFGLSPIKTIRFISSLCASLGLLLLFITYKGFLSGLLILSFPIIALLAGALEVARFEGADAIAFLIFSWFVLHYFKGSLWCLLPLALLPLARSDMVILSVLLSVICFYEFKSARISVIFAMFFAVIFYWSVNYSFGNYGWEKQFYVANVEYLGYPADVETVIGVKEYVNGLIGGLSKLFYDKAFLFFIIMSLVVFSIQLKNSGMDIEKYKIHLQLSSVAVLFVAIHFVVFPIMHIRYFAGQYVLVSLSAVAMLAQVNKKPTNVE